MQHILNQDHAHLFYFKSPFRRILDFRVPKQQAGTISIYQKIHTPLLAAPTLEFGVWEYREYISTHTTKTPPCTTAKRTRVLKLKLKIYASIVLQIHCVGACVLTQFKVHLGQSVRTSDVSQLHSKRTNVDTGISIRSDKLEWLAICKIWRPAQQFHCACKGHWT